MWEPKTQQMTVNGVLGGVLTIGTCTLDLKLNITYQDLKWYDATTFININNLEHREQHKSKHSFKQIVFVISPCNTDQIHETDSQGCIMKIQGHLVTETTVLTLETYETLVCYFHS